MKPLRNVALALFPLLLLAAGCQHAKPSVPSLPASHGHLSRSMDLYLAEQQKDAPSFVPTALFEEKSGVIVEPAQAPAVFAEAVQVLSGNPSQEEVKQAAEDLWAACDAGHLESCAFMRENYKRPKKLSGRPPEFPSEALRKQRHAIVVVKCHIGVDGVLRNCTPIEGAQYGVTEAVLSVLASSKYAPVTLAGHPIETPYTFTMRFMPVGVGLTTEQELQWARARAARFPHSSGAWTTLAEKLAEHAPEDPWYADSLHYLHALSPWHWWANNELAWNHAQKGEYTAATPLAKRARALEADNPYVLETYAAVMAATGQCEQALLDQRRAVAKLPAEWPAPEKERFTRTLEEYRRKCEQATPAAPEPSASP